MAFEAIAREGRGLLIYEHQEGRGIGLMAKLQAYALQDRGLDTLEANDVLGFSADYRDYRLPAAINRSPSFSRSSSSTTTIMRPAFSSLIASSILANSNPSSDSSSPSWR